MINFLREFSGVARGIDHENGGAKTTDLWNYSAVTFRCFFSSPNLLLKDLEIRTENVHGDGTLWKRLVVNGG